MSLEELAGQVRVHNSIVLMIQEQMPLYTLDKIVYNAFDAKTLEYNESYCVLRHKYNGVRVEVNYCSIVDYFKWRKKYKIVRRVILEENPELRSLDIFKFEILDEEDGFLECTDQVLHMIYNRLNIILGIIEEDKKDL